MKKQSEAAAVNQTQKCKSSTTHTLCDAETESKTHREKRRKYLVGVRCVCGGESAG